MEREVFSEANLLVNDHYSIDKEEKPDAVPLSDLLNYVISILQLSHKMASTEAIRTNYNILSMIRRFPQDYFEEKSECSP